jgi:AcrR family transcriptional regulator
MAPVTQGPDASVGGTAAARGLAPGRRWRGATLTERAAQRRQQLLDAGLETFGTVGLRNTTVRGICLQAGLTERYFYESFHNLLECFSAVHDAAVRTTLNAMELGALEARRAGGDRQAVARAGVTSVVTTLHKDPRLARVMLLEALGVDRTTEQQYRNAMVQAAALLTSLSDSSEPRSEMVRVGVVGSTLAIVLMWLLDDFRTPVEEILDQCTAIVEAVLVQPRAA